MRISCLDERYKLNEDPFKWMRGQAHQHKRPTRRRGRLTRRLQEQRNMDDG